jgi:hypothetical protein
MSKRVLEIYIEFDLMDSRTEHFMKWFVGWLYLWGMRPRCREFECGECKWHRCSEDVALGVIKVSVESSVNMFDFVLLFAFDFVRLVRTCPMGVKVAVCENDECIDMNVKDWKRWYKELLR